jgi:hypothetical protein
MLQVISCITIYLLNFANIKTLNFHQKIADSWPASIDDTEARKLELE